MAYEETGTTPAPEMNAEQMRKLGLTLKQRYEQYQKDRRETEMQWLMNLRQFRGIYDPNVEKRIAEDQSHAYPKITRTKVIGTVARLMEMLFPQTEKNYGVESSPLPDLSETDLQAVLDQLAVEKPGVELTDEMIERAIKSFADAKATRMGLEIDDQLQEIDYLTLARAVVFRAVLYSIGLLKGPMVVSKKSRTWTRDVAGKLKAAVVDKNAPMYELVSVWDWYPDLSAKMFESMDGSFYRHVQSRNQFAELAKRPDFMKKAITDWLAVNTTGNYKELHWEIELRTKGDRSNLTDLNGRKYEWWEWWGCVSGHDLVACGIAVSDLSAEYEANVCGIGDTIIKALLNPYDSKIRPYHAFVYEEDDINLLGVGLPTVMRDSQLAICEASRMMLDNASVVCGPILEINMDLLMPGQNLDIHAFKTFLREGVGQEAGMRAVNAVQVDSHIDDLTKVINLFMSFADTETALPPPALGDASQGGSEAYRTQGGASMLLGAAALPIRDTVRNFDKFTTSFISSLYYWNMQFNDNDAIKGDFAVIARGSTSLIAKEVRSTHLDQFMVTLSEDEKIYLSTERVLKERMAVRDLPLSLLEDPDVVKSKLDERAKNAQAQAAMMSQQLSAEIKATVAGAFKDFALGIKAQTGANVDTFLALVEGVTNASETKGAGASSNSTSKSG